MKVNDQVKIKGYERIFIIDCLVNGWALLKKQQGDTFKVLGWEHVLDLTPVKI